MNAITGDAGGGGHVALLRRIKRTLPHTTLWLDLGVRDMDDYEAVRALDIGTPVIGSETLAETDTLAALKRARADCILSLDFDARRLRGPAGLLDAAAHWPATVIVLALDAIGGGGPRLELPARARELAPQCKVAYGGGVRHGRDLRALEAAGADYVLAANALYTAKI